MSASTAQRPGSAGATRRHTGLAEVWAVLVRIAAELACNGA
jgi:hypothetical protein